MKRSILQNLSFNFINSVTSYAFSFLTLLYVTRVLRPDAFGRASFAAVFAGYFVMLANLGLPHYGMRSCAESREDRKELSTVFHELWSIHAVLAVLSTAAFMLAVALVPKLRENSLLLAVYGCGVIFQIFGCDWFYRGLEKFRFLAIVTFVSKTVSLLCIVLFVRSEQHTLLYAVISVLADAGSSLICFFSLKKYADISFRLRINRKHFKPLLVFFMMTLAVSIYTNLDLTMLGFMKTDFETGLYSLISRGKQALGITGGLVITSTLPLASILWKSGDSSRLRSLAEKSYLAVIAIQTALALVCIVFARYIILFAGGSTYLSAVPAFRILMLSLIPIAASNILGGVVLIPTGNEKKLLQAEAAGAVFNFLANLILIPLLSITGAALTTVLSEVIVWILCVYYVNKSLRMDFGPGMLVRLKGKILLKCAVPLIRARSRLMGGRLPYYCPCCDTHLKQFLDAGYDKQPEMYQTARYLRHDQHVICPVCGALPRHRILVSWMAEHRELLENRKILHFAQELALRLWMDRNGISATTSELYTPADLNLNVEDTGLEDDAYDLIICNHVLEHVSDFRKALAELHRILRPGGQLIISFPTDPALETVYEDASVTSEKERIEHFGQYDHLRVFGKDSPALLERAGFRVTEIRGEDFPPEIKPVIGPADYDYNVLWCLTKEARG